MRGSDQDDCVIMGVTRLTHYLYPYSERSYLGNPCSTGVGIFILYFPFVLLNAYPAAAVFAIMAATFIVNLYTKNIYKTSVFLLFSLSSIFLIELMATGSDLIVLGYGILALSYGLVISLKNKSMKLILIFALLAGLLSSSRINMIVLAPLFAFLIYTHWKRAAINFFSISLVVAIVPSAYLYFINPSEFTPLYLIGKGSYLVISPYKELTALVSISLTFLGARITRNDLQKLPLAVFISIAPMLISVSLGDFFIRGLNPATWEGANYLIPVIPLATALFVISAGFSRQKHYTSH